MKSTKIDWCDTTWNPVWGCNNDCSFCYARKIAKRFGSNIEKKEEAFRNRCHIPFDYNDGDIINFKPTYIFSNCLPIKVQKRDKLSPKIKVFVNSMSDIFYWDPIWMYRVLGQIALFPYDRFLFLTKFPEVYKKYSFPDNCWLGLSITGLETNPNYRYSLLSNIPAANRFISFEPLLARPMDIPPGIADWIIIGAQTNPYKKVPPDYYNALTYTAAEYNIPVFFKNSMGSPCNFHQEFPEDLKEREL